MTTLSQEINRIAGELFVLADKTPEELAAWAASLNPFEKMIAETIMGRAFDTIMEESQE